MSTRFDCILIANRGEIACRVIRTASSLGYRTIAVYSQADADAPHTLLADDAVYIGPSPVQESYLRADKIIQAAIDSGAQAIHPGYGFLSENAEFANACAEANLVFIGPSAQAIHVMGNKAESKRKMLSVDVPCVPGYQGESQQDEVLFSKATEIGVPIMVKAAAGGGGRGMRLVSDMEELPSALALARSEAQNAFGSSELILEKAIIEPRHVEIQIFADEFGNTVYLGERDCSVQRRHQKVIEEAPCPVMTPTLREQMGEAAVAAAKSINYVGAGTVEFLLDVDQRFYFLEMNTRLQVEHPVTELITGLDLVELQIQVAQGQALGISQDQVELNGHAIEVRLYSEDPAQDFLPSSGLIEDWIPATGEGIRVDHGIRTGQEISPFYDSMVAKVVAHGPDREVARRRLINALKETVFEGLKNNRSFLIKCLEKRSFIDGLATTGFIAQQFRDHDFSDSGASLEQSAMSAVLMYVIERQEAMDLSLGISEKLSNWSSTGSMQTYVEYVLGEEVQQWCIRPINSSVFEVVSSEDELVRVELGDYSDNAARLIVDGCRHDIKFTHHDGKLTLIDQGRSLSFVNQIKYAGIEEDEADGGRVTAPMHGLVLDLKVSKGQVVSKGQSLLIVEAMKMQHEICATVDGEITDVFVSSGSQVATDQALLEISDAS